ncbi:hypothetical protein EDB85DRAFT_1938632 [Lactarius pseudohatsudake]|nr:hypothetical protein EDB85DRAFT_1938632 [Lactarius pseudohatsudake]
MFLGAERRLSCGYPFSTSLFAFQTGLSFLYIVLCWHREPTRPHSLLWGDFLQRVGRRACSLLPKTCGHGTSEVVPNLRQDPLLQSKWRQCASSPSPLQLLAAAVPFALGRAFEFSRPIYSGNPGRWFLPLLLTFSAKRPRLGMVRFGSIRHTMIHPFFPVTVIVCRTPGPAGSSAIDISA